MGASKRKQEVNNHHVKNYVQAVFAKRLQEEGFVSLENRDICWYRMKND